MPIHFYLMVNRDYPIDHRQGLSWDPYNRDIASMNDFLAVPKKDEIATVKGRLHGL
jgi:hypothetical protein